MGRHWETGESWGDTGRLGGHRERLGDWGVIGRLGSHTETKGIIGESGGDTGTLQKWWDTQH